MNVSFSKSLMIFASLVALSGPLMADVSYAVTDGVEPAQAGSHFPKALPSVMGQGLPLEYFEKRYLEMNNLRARFNRAQARKGLDKGQIEAKWEQEHSRWAATLVRRSLMGKEIAYPWAFEAQGTEWRTDMLDPTFGPAFVRAFAFSHNGSTQDQWDWFLDRASHAQILGKVAPAHRGELEGLIDGLVARYSINLERGDYLGVLQELACVPQQAWSRVKGHLDYFFSGQEDRMRKSCVEGGLEALKLEGRFLSGFNMFEAVYPLVEAELKGRMEPAVELVKLLAIPGMSGVKKVSPMANEYEEKWEKTAAVVPTARAMVAEGNEDVLSIASQLLWHSVSDERSIWVFEGMQRYMRKFHGLAEGFSWKFADASVLRKVIMILSSFESEGRMSDFIEIVMKELNKDKRHTTWAERADASPLIGTWVLGAFEGALLRMHEGEESSSTTLAQAEDAFASWLVRIDGTLPPAVFTQPQINVARLFHVLEGSAQGLQAKKSDQMKELQCHIQAIIAWLLNRGKNGSLAQTHQGWFDQNARVFDAGVVERSQQANSRLGETRL